MKLKEKIKILQKFCQTPQLGLGAKIEKLCSMEIHSVCRKSIFAGLIQCGIDQDKQRTRFKPDYY